MSAWFDTYAKRSARATPKPPVGVSRRRVITGGSAAVGAAWAAPLLTSAPAYAYGVSGCASNKICGNPGPNELQFCCIGVVAPNPGSSYTCRVEGTVNTCDPTTGNGSFCSNQGQGTCGTSASCNGDGATCNCGSGRSAPTYLPHTCGGYGASCTSIGSSTNCSLGYACSADSKGTCYQICGGTSGVSCPSGFSCTITGGTSTCRKTCTDTTVCPKGSPCTAGVCA